MVCPNCHAPMPDGSEFCPSCGKRPNLPPPSFCSKCGQPIKAGQQFCSSCGERAGSVDPVSSRSGPAFMPPGPGATPPFAPPPQSGGGPQGNSGRDLFFWLPFGILLLLFALFFAVTSVGVIGWGILVAGFVVLFLLKSRFIAGGALLNVVAWVAVAALLFITLAVALPSKEGNIQVDTGKTAQPTAGVFSPASTATVSKPAPAPSSTTVATSPTRAPTSTSVPTSAPPAVATAKVQNMALGLGADNDYKIISPTSTFRPDVAQIQLSFEVIGVKGETSVDVQWVYLPTGEVISFAGPKIIDDRRMPANLTKPTNDFPTGDYKVIVLLNGKEAGSMPFSVVASPASSSSTRLQNVAMGLGVDNDTKIVGPTTVFRTDTPEVFVSAEVINVPGPTDISSTWIYLDTSETIDTVTVQTPKDTRVQFSLPKPPARAWPVGRYRVVLMINGVEAVSVNYSIQ